MKVLRMVGNALLITFCVITSSAMAQVSWPEKGSASVQKPDRLPDFRNGYGRAHLPITCTYRRTQMLFDQGLAMLHGFDRRNALKSFRQVTLIEPEAPAGWLGMALATLDHPEQARKYIGSALQLTRNASPLEAAMLVAVYASTESSNKLRFDPRIRLADEWKKLILQFPEELALRALFAQHSIETNVGEISDEIGSELIKVLSADDTHALHACGMLAAKENDRDSAVTAALKSCSVAPKNPHVWRIAGTICAYHRDFPRSIEMLASALRLYHQEMSQDGLLPDETPGYVDTCDQLVQSFARAGHFESALTLARHMTMMPSTRTWVWDKKYRDPQCVCVRGAGRLIWLLSELERWEELAVFTAASDFSGPDNECARRLGAGRAAFAMNRPDLLHDQVQHLRTHQEYCDAQKKRLQHDPLQRSRVPDLQESEAYWTSQKEQTEAAQSELEWLSSLNQNHNADTRQGVATLKRPSSWQPLTDLLMDDFESAAASAEKILRQAPEDAILVSRAHSVFERLGDVQRLRGMEDAWKSVQSAQSKSLASELLWRPSQAESWTMPDRDGELHSLEDHRGKPLLMVYYLGAGCPHCIEQLQVMAPMQSEFESAGLSVVTVSSDSIEGLVATFQVVGAEKSLPFLVLSDQDKEAFQTYGAWNEFDREPQHGVYLIDEEGRIRWAIRGAEPFLNIRFLLDESQRLLNSNHDILSPGAPVIRQ